MLEENFEKNGGEYTEFQVGELFAVKSNPQLNKSAFSFSESGSYPYFTRTVSNNGILGYVDYLDDEHKIKGNAIAVGMLGMQFFYMATDFYAGQFTKTIYPKFEGFNEEVALYFISLFNKQSTYLSGRLVREFENEFTKIRIKLPTLNGELALGYMADRIRELEADRIRELEAYLQVAGLSSYTLTDEEKELIRGGVGKTQSFRLEEIFTAQAGDTDIQHKHINGRGCYYINSGVENMGISGKTDIPARLFNKNTLTVDMFGLVFYRDFQYKLATHGHVFSLSNIAKPINQEEGLYLCAAMSYFKKIYSYNNMCNWSKISKNNIELPVNESGIDWVKMKTYISALEKEVIGAVVKWKDKEIECMKKVVEGSHIS